MIIEIIKCAKSSYWYNDKIGEKFVVNYPIEDCWKVWKGVGSFCVLKTDCKIIEY